MLDKLVELGIRDIDIKNIEEFINDDNLEDFNKIIDLFVNINCSPSMIRNIVVGNPYIMQRSYEDIINLINYMTSIGLNNLNLMFDSYPPFLNKDKFEIEDYVNTKLNEGILLEDIVDELDNNPMIIDEI